MFATRLMVPRGLAAGGIEEPMLASYSASYALPLWYPDISIGALAYVRRIRGNLFADRMDFYSEQRKRIVRFDGAGYELLFDFHPFRFPVLLSAGWRQTATRTSSSIGYKLKTIPTELLLSFSY
jgi:hypothetical protein